MLQNLSIVASSGLENKFKPLIEMIAVQVLPRQADSAISINHLLILKEHAILILGNLVFDSTNLLKTTLMPQWELLKSLIAQIHFKRTQLTSAVLWTINNFLNQSQNLDENVKEALLQSLTNN